MGLLHSRASKKRDKAAARLLDEEARQLRQAGRQAGKARHRADAERRQEAAGGNPWRQPTLGGMISRLAEQKRREQ